MTQTSRLVGILVGATCVLTGGCAHRPESKISVVSLEQIQLPELDTTQSLRWENAPVLPGKRKTDYQPVGSTPEHSAEPPSIHARSQAAASALTLRLQPLAAPKSIRWSWKIIESPEEAASLDPTREDSAARIILMFAAPSSAAQDALPLRDQLAMEKARLLLRTEPPYATLMYLWSADKPAEAVFVSRHTGRVRGVVVDGPASAGRWQHFDRDVQADFQRAFGEVPGPLIGVAIMTDSDNTRSRAEARFRDLHLR